MCALRVLTNQLYHNPRLDPNHPPVRGIFVCHSNTVKSATSHYYCFINAEFRTNAEYLTLNYPDVYSCNKGKKWLYYSRFITCVPQKWYKEMYSTGTSKRERNLQPGCADSKYEVGSSSYVRLCSRAWRTCVCYDSTSIILESVSERQNCGWDKIPSLIRVDTMNGRTKERTPVCVKLCNKMYYVPDDNCKCVCVGGVLGGGEGNVIMKLWRFKWYCKTHFFR